jgi:hypothetical protein
MHWLLKFQSLNTLIMALSAAVNRTKGKVEIKKMRRLRPRVDTHFFNTTLAKRTRAWFMAEIGADD